MTTNIYKKTIDVNKLNEEIEKYKCLMKEDKVYLFMNSKTNDDLFKAHFQLKLDINIRVNDTRIIQLNGCSVYCDDTLQDGEVDIR